MKAVYAQLGFALNAAAAALPAAAVTKTSYSTEYLTVTSCGPSVTNCPAQSTVVSTIVHPASSPAAAPSACVTSLFDGCNPARSTCSNGPGTFVTVTPSTYPTSYFIGCNPARSSCSNGPGVFVTLTSAPSICASSTAAPVPTSSAYQCNPAHSYPGGVSCDATARTLVYPTTSSAPVASASACVTSLFDGCNPARSTCTNGPGTFVTVTPSTYPTSYFIGCNPARSSCSNGPGVFVTLTSAPSICASASSTAAPVPTSTAYQCNPAHSYPGGVTCDATARTLVYPSTTAPAAQNTAPATKASVVTGSVCQTGLTGSYETPHLIVPVDSKNPDKAYGTQYNADISGDKSTIFNFDIPYSYQNKQCTVLFLFPEQKDLVTSSFTQSGSGGLVFSHLTSPATEQTTFKNAPSVDKVLNTIDGVKPGNSYVVSSGPCAPGTKQAIKVSSTGGYALNYFQDWNPSPIGLFMTVC